MNAPDQFLEHRNEVPQAIEAEQSILGALMTDNDAVDRISRLRPEHFFRFDHRLIFEAIQKLIVSNRRADLITVFEALSSMRQGEQIGGLAYLNTLAQNAPGSAGISRWADIVIDRWKLRGIISAADEISAMAYNRDGRSVEQILNEAQAKFEPLVVTTAKDPQYIKSFLTPVIERIDDQYHGREAKVRTLSTGLRDLDSKLGGGMRPGQLIVVAGRPAMGKAQPLDAKVRTSSGWVAMGDLKVGDSLASIDGAKSIVTGIFPQGVKAVSRVTFSDGRSTEACAEHLWRVHHRKWAEPKVMSTAEVESLLSRPDMSGRLWVDSVSGDFGSDGDLPVDPWLLGALLGDGDFTQGTVRFSKDATEILDRVRQALPETVELTPAGGCDYRLSNPCYVRGVAGSNPLTKAMEDLSLMGAKSQTKFIPAQYLYGSRETRLAVLRGLLDTDGWVEKFGSVRFSTSSEALADGVVELVRSLGFWCSLRQKATSYVKNGVRHECSTAHTMTISGHGLSELFLFSEKAIRCADRTGGKRVAFKSITPSREVECQCISVSHPTHLYVTDDYIVTHNTAIALGLAEAAARIGAPTLFFSQEMPGEELANRALARASGLPLDKILDGRKFSNDAEFDQLTVGTVKVSDLEVIVDEQPALSLSEIRGKARAVKRRHGLGLIVIDYLGLMADGDGNTRNEKVGANSRGAKALAKQLEVPVVLLAQLNRKLEERSNRRPMLSDLRDSGEIEQDADIVLFLYRDQVYNPDTKDRGIGEINVAKQRNGPTGTVGAAYIEERTMFADLMPGTKFGGTDEGNQSGKSRRGME